MCRIRAIISLRVDARIVANLLRQTERGCDIFVVVFLFKEPLYLFSYAIRGYVIFFVVFLFKNRYSYFLTPYVVVLFFLFNRYIYFLTPNRGSNIFFVQPLFLFTPNRGCDIFFCSTFIFILINIWNLDE